MISIVLPYWERQPAADKALALMAETYKGVDLEVIVVDDGNPIPFVIPEVELNIRVVTLPRKTIAKSPVTAWNAGAMAANGEILVLSCVEILHEKPVLQEMVAELRGLGPKGYVLAAAWCPEEGVWHCHSSVDVPQCPKGSGIAFCAAMHRELFFAAGGFDEAYREGAGYEDRDLIRALHKIGAKFVIRDDLAVIHPKTGASISWPGSFEKNREIFDKKWPDTAPTVICCVSLGNYQGCGADYVNKLFEMVGHNIPAGSYRFVCLTDDPSGLSSEIHPIHISEDGWWGKLHLFKAGLFPDGSRVIYFDLDTVITGSLEPLVSYSGDFATLSDFYQPHRMGPAIMAWKAGAVNRIWDEWEHAGRPKDGHGDLWWLNSLPGFKRDILQDMYPGMFVSFKAHCSPYPPSGAKVVCFHGEPRPHNCGVEWVEKIRNGMKIPDFESVCNTHHETIESNIRSACERDIPWLEFSEPHQGQAVIVAGGPSLKRTLHEVRLRFESGQTIIAVNGAGKFLSEAGIRPHIQIVIDARPENVKFLGYSHVLFLASQCDPALFDASRVDTLFHMNTAGIESILPKDRVAHLISSGTTVGLAAMAISYVLGYRTIHLHGFDSSYEEDHHAYSQESNDADAVVEVWAADRKFKSTPWMVQQVNQFQILASELAQDGVTITVAGDGLLPHVARQMMIEEEAA